jgi:hypothetical protein
MLTPMKTLTAVAIGIASAVAAAAITSAIYENGPVKSLRAELAVATLIATTASERADDQAGIILSCNEAMVAYGQLAIDYRSNYDASRTATNNFFDRYNANAGDANFLYFVLYAADRAMEDAASMAQPAMTDAATCSQGLLR